MRDTFLNPRFVLGPLSPSAYRNHLSILQKRTQMSRVSALERVRVATGFNYKRGKMRPSTREAVDPDHCRSVIVPEHKDAYSSPLTGVPPCLEKVSSSRTFIAVQRSAFLLDTDRADRSQDLLFARSILHFFTF